MFGANGESQKTDLNVKMNMINLQPTFSIKSIYPFASSQIQFISKDE